MDDDTKLIVKGVEVKSGEPTKTSFDMLEKPENDDDIDDESESDKQVTFKSDLSLNKKVEKKIQKKRKADESEDEDDDEDDEEEIYRSEDIPRTKKWQKLEMKKKHKKVRRNGKKINSKNFKEFS